MARSEGQHSYGVQLFSNVLDTAPPGVVGDLAGWSNIGEIISINGLEMTSSETKLTHLASPNKAHEYIGGFIDGGSVSAKTNLSAAQVAVLYARVQGTGSNRANSNLHWFIYIPDWGGFYFEAFLKQLPMDVPDDAAITMDLGLKVSGIVTPVAF